MWLVSWKGWSWCRPPAGMGRCRPTCRSLTWRSPGLTSSCSPMLSAPDAIRRRATRPSPMGFTSSPGALPARHRNSRGTGWSCTSIASSGQETAFTPPWPGTGDRSSSAPGSPAAAGRPRTRLIGPLTGPIWRSTPGCGRWVFTPRAASTNSPPSAWAGTGGPANGKASRAALAPRASTLSAVDEDGCLCVSGRRAAGQDRDVDILSSRVLLRPADFDRSLRFYRDVLGLAIYREYGSPANPWGVVLRGPGLLQESGGSAGPAGRSVMIWLQVRDVQAEHGRLAAAAARILRGPTAESSGLIEKWIECPGRVPVHLVEVPVDHPLRRHPRSAPPPVIKGS